MTIHYRSVRLVGLAMFVASPAFSQNDECSTAAPIVLGTTAFDTTAATPSSETWTCTSLTRTDVWFVYTAPNTNILQVRVNPTAPTFFAAYTGSCSALTSLACAVAPSTAGGAFTFRPGAPGDSIYVRVGSVFTAGSLGDVILTELPPPPNDECINATPLVVGVPESFNTVPASDSGLPFFCASGVGPDVWYSYVATNSNAMLRVETCGSQLDTVIEAFEGGCGLLVPLACNDRYCGDQSRISIVNPVAGQTYTFRVGGFAGAVGEGAITVAELEPPVQACVLNPGFETGDAVGWTLTDFPSPFIPAQVGLAGRTSNFFSSEPTEGKFSLTHGFRTSTPGVLTLSQDVTVSGDITPLTFDWRAGWNVSSFGTMDRTFDVVVRDLMTGSPLQTTNILTIEPATTLLDSGTQRGLVDLSMFVGQTVTVSLEWSVLEAATGSLFFELDNVLCPSAGGGFAVVYCSPSAPNSTGVSASISASGTAELALNMLTVAAADLPPNTFGYFLTSMTQASVSPGGGAAGTLCLGGDVGRYSQPGQIMSSGPAGEIMLPLDLTMTPQSTGLVAIAAGETWSFQAWFRDSILGLNTSNLTDGVQVTFY